MAHENIFFREPFCLGIIPVALLFPRIAVIMVSAHFPESGYITIGKLYAFDPFRAFPEI